MDYSLLGSVVFAIGLSHLVVTYFVLIDGSHRVDTKHRSGERGVVYLARIIAQALASGFYGWRILGRVCWSLVSWLFTRKNGGPA